MRHKVALFVITCVLLSVAGARGSRAASDGAVSPELMLFEEIPTVVTATRTEQSVRDAPSAVTVITAREIRASGATSLEELLQTVPGLDLMRISKSDLNVRSRGFVSPSSSGLLVMIDGRSVYLDFFGVTLWEQLNVTLFDIERIEVVRGPGSALYGANAFLGTVNIVTKRARDLPSLYTRTGMGTESTLVTTTGAASAGRLAIKGSAEYDVRDNFRNSANPAPNTDRDRHDTGPRSRLFNATLEYTMEGGAEIIVSGGSSFAKGDILTGVGTFDYDGPISYGRVNLRRGPWSLQGFVTHADVDLDAVIMTPPAPPWPSTPDLSATVLDLDVQRTLGWSTHQLLAGVNLRRLRTDSRDILGDREEETLYSGFLQDEFGVTDDLTAFFSARLDEHPKTGFQVSPRAALVYKLGETGRIRASFARSFQNPTQINNYSSYAASPFAFVTGDEDLDPTWVTAYELGGQYLPHPRLSAKLDLFLNVITDFQAFTVLAPGLPTVLGFQNTGRTKAWGSEVALEWRWSPALNGFATYSFQSAHGPLEEYTPRGKASLGVRGALASRLRYALTGVYSGHSELEPGALTAAGLIAQGLDLDVPSRFTVDGFLGLRLWGDVELGVHARNMFHRVRQHHPLGDEIGSELLFTLTGEF